VPHRLELILLAGEHGRVFVEAVVADASSYVLQHSILHGAGHADATHEDADGITQGDEIQHIPSRFGEAAVVAVPGALRKATFTSLLAPSRHGAHRVRPRCASPRSRPPRTTRRVHR
jgi:hypothetical protein